jgi:hypothetical protein
MDKKAKAPEFAKGLLERAARYADRYAARELPDPERLPKDEERRKQVLAGFQKDRAALAAKIAPKMQALVDMLAPLPAGKYHIEPPPYGCRHQFLGELKPGTKPFDKKLTSSQATALRARDQPFKLTSLEE